MPPQTVRGKWTSESSGGCPRNESWTNNPQYLLLPASAGTFSVTLKCAAAPKLDIGFVVLRQDAKDKAGRKTSAKVRKAELEFKTKWRTTDLVTAEVELNEPAPGKGFIVLPCTFEPGHQAAFELSVSSGVDFTLMPIGDQPAAPPTNENAAANGARPPPPTASSQPAPAAAAASATYAKAETPAADGSAAPAEGEVVVRSEGQGLSAKQKKDAADLIQAALASAGESGGLYTDSEFPASASSLWIDGSGPGEALQQAGVAADLVASWRRPSEIAGQLSEADGEPRLFYTDWGLQGVVASPLLNHWLLAACNIIGGDVEILERCFVDTEHAANGFYVVRFYVDDPNSDDDWQVVLVDDLLPCGADGLPCFAHCPSPAVFWVCILEKAFAKLQKSYEATSGGSVEDGLLYLTGGLSREVGISPTADSGMIDALWQQVMEWWATNHVIGCEHRIDAEPSAELLATGLLPNTPYCVVTGGEPDGAGRMVRLRTFHGYSEWKGKWADNDPAWTSRLRQSLAYSDAEDGTFWMAFEDFVTWFNVLFVCRMADDRWTTMSVHSRWQDGSAGGCPPNFATWRENPQWLLKTGSSPLRLTVTLSLPQPPPPANGAAVPLFPPEAAIGLSVLTANAGVDVNRRKLLIASADELVVRAEPRPVRRLVSDIELEPSKLPYLLVPHTYMPGRESAFTLTVRADDADDDGVADFTLEPIRKESDWVHSAKQLVWEDALTHYEPAADEYADAAKVEAPGGPPSAPGFKYNPRIELQVEKTGRFFVVVDQIGVAEGDGYPPIGVAMVSDPEVAFADGQISDSEILVQEGPVSADSVMIAIELQAAETPYCIMPYLADPESARAAHPELGCRVCVYSDAPFTLRDSAPTEEDDTGGPGVHALDTTTGRCICWGLGRFPGKQNPNMQSCVMLKVYNSIKRMEAGLERQLKYLDGLGPIEGNEPRLLAQPCAPR